MNDVEYGKCQVCDTVDQSLTRKYFYYDIPCGCCVGDQHFDYVAHCGTCIPEEPQTTTISILKDPNIIKLEQLVKDKGILQISGAVFGDIKMPITAKRPKGRTIKANTTVREYCEFYGNIVNLTPDEYAKEVLASMSAPSQLVVGECEKCWSFILEGSEHECRSNEINQETTTK